MRPEVALGSGQAMARLAQRVQLKVSAQPQSHQILIALDQGYQNIPKYVPVSRVVSEIRARIQLADFGYTRIL